MTRMERLRGVMRAQEVDLVVLGAGAHLWWLTGVRPHADERPFLLCVTFSYAGFLMPSLEAENARQHTNFPFHIWADDQGPDTAFAALLKEADATHTCLTSAPMGPNRVI